MSPSLHTLSSLLTGSLHEASELGSEPCAARCPYSSCHPRKLRCRRRGPRRRRMRPACQRCQWLPWYYLGKSLWLQLILLCNDDFAFGIMIEVFKFQLIYINKLLFTCLYIPPVASSPSMKLLVNATSKPAANLAYCSGAARLKLTSFNTQFSNDSSVISDNFFVVSKVSRLK